MKSCSIDVSNIESKSVFIYKQNLITKYAFLFCLYFLFFRMSRLHQIDSKMCDFLIFFGIINHHMLCDHF